MIERTVTNKREVDHKLEEKIHDIEFIKNEIVIQRKEVVKEIDNLLLYIERIHDALNALKLQGQSTCNKCLVLREGRLGIDLVRL